MRVVNIRSKVSEVVRQCVEKGLVSGKLMATDSTHVKANASRASEYLAEVREEPGAYWERLDTYAISRYFTITTGSMGGRPYRR